MVARTARSRCGEGSGSRCGEGVGQGSREQEDTPERPRCTAYPASIRERAYMDGALEQEGNRGAQAECQSERASGGWGCDRRRGEVNTQQQSAACRRSSSPACSERLQWMRVKTIH